MLRRSEGLIIRFVDYAMYRVRLMRHHGIEPYIVFDGGPLPAKKKTEVSREKYVNPSPSIEV
jgi:5'-3' exonuclease